MRIYFASDIKHAKKWIFFRERMYPHVIVVSSWIDLLKDGEPNLTLEKIRESWLNNQKDLILCDALVLYHEPGDSLRGALFEAGAAFSLAKPIYFVGDPAVLGSLGLMFYLHDSLDTAIYDLVTGTDDEKVTMQ